MENNLCLNKTSIFKRMAFNRLSLHISLKHKDKFPASVDSKTWEMLPFILTVVWQNLKVDFQHLIS